MQSMHVGSTFSSFPNIQDENISSSIQCTLALFVETISNKIKSIIVSALSQSNRVERETISYYLYKEENISYEYTGTTSVQLILENKNIDFCMNYVFLWFRIDTKRNNKCFYTYTFTADPNPFPTYGTLQPYLVFTKSNPCVILPPQLKNWVDIENFGDDEVTGRHATEIASSSNEGKGRWITVGEANVLDSRGRVLAWCRFFKWLRCPNDRNWGLIQYPQAFPVKILIKKVV